MAQTMTERPRRFKVLHIIRSCVGSEEHNDVKLRKQYSNIKKSGILITNVVTKHKRVTGECADFDEEEPLYHSAVKITALKRKEGFDKLELPKI